MKESTQGVHGLRQHKFGKVWIIKLLLFVILLLMVFGFLVMSLWNWLIPPIFGWQTISYWQAVGLLILTRILFGGFIGRPRRHGGGFWTHWMFERWPEMTPEERQKFRERLWRDFGPFEPPPPQSKS